MKRMILIILITISMIFLNACGNVSTSTSSETSTIDRQVDESKEADVSINNENELSELTKQFNESVDKLSENQTLLKQLRSDGGKLLHSTESSIKGMSVLARQLEYAKYNLKETIPEIGTNQKDIAEQIEKLSTKNEETLVLLSDLTSAIVKVRTEIEGLKAAKDGIIVVTGHLGNKFLYKGKGYTPYTVELNKINPENGVVTHIRTFSNEKTHMYTPGMINHLGFNHIGGYKRYTLNSFNSDLTLMAVLHTLSDGSEHVGWVDSDGRFTDVSEMITTQSDFGARISHSNPFFFDNYFYFRDNTNDLLQFKRVPLDNLSKDAVELMLDDVHWAELYPLPNGSMVDVLSKHDYFDSSMKYPAYTYCIYDWLSADTCIGCSDISDKPTDIYKIHLSGETDDWISDKSLLVPSIKDRKNWSARVSPSKDRVAFLSKITSGNQPTNLFWIPIDGGEPVKINTDLPLEGGYVGLLDWR